MFNTMFDYNPISRVYTVKVGNTLVGELYAEADGFYVFDPIVGRTGYWPEWMLRSIADKLQEVNKEWQEEITKALAAIPPEEPSGLDTFEVPK